MNDIYNPMDSIPDIQRCHEIYCSLTTTDPKAFPLRRAERFLGDMLREGFTVEDFTIFLRWRTWLNKQASEPKYRKHMQLYNLLGDMDIFCADVVEARRWQARQQARINPKQQAVNEFWRHELPQRIVDSSQSVKDVLRKALQ